MVYFSAATHLPSEERVLLISNDIWHFNFYINFHDKVFTNAENVEAKSIDDRLVDKLVRERIKPNMSVQL